MTSQGGGKKATNKSFFCEKRGSSLPGGKTPLKMRTSFINVDFSSLKSEFIFVFEGGRKRQKAFPVSAGP